jgi:complement component 1 Q subcomponent-binding protein
MLCQDGTFAIENLSYYDDAKTGTDLTAEADWNRRGLYIGPQVDFFTLLSPYICSFAFQFDTLDVGVQDAFDQYLNERGVNESVAFFIPEYASYKEQQVSVRFFFLRSSSL